MNEFDASYTLVREMKEGLVLDIRQVEDEFGHFLLSNFHGCSTYGSLVAFLSHFIVPWPPDLP